MEKLKYSEKKRHLKDLGDLTQTIIIVSALAVASIVGIGSVTTSIMDKGEQVSRCLANKSSFKPGQTSPDCKDEETENNGNPEDSDNTEDAIEAKEDIAISFDWVMTQHRSYNFLTIDGVPGNVLYTADFAGDSFDYDFNGIEADFSIALQKLIEDTQRNPEAYAHLSNMSIEENEAWMEEELLSYSSDETKEAYGFLTGNLRREATKSCNEIADNSQVQFPYYKILAQGINSDNSFTVSCYGIKDFPTFETNNTWEIESVSNYNDYNYSVTIQTLFATQEEAENYINENKAQEDCKAMGPMMWNANLTKGTYNNSVGYIQPKVSCSFLIKKTKPVFTFNAPIHKNSNIGTIDLEKLVNNN